MGVITKSPYINGPDLLYCHNGCVTRAVQLDFGEADMLPAGTPISPDGKVVNDVTALGILQHDTYKDFGSGMGVLIIGGLVDLAKAQEHSGVVLTAEAKAAMKQIVFVGDTEVPSGGGANLNELFETELDVKLTWDGDTTGLDKVTLYLEEFGGEVSYYRISDVPVSKGVINEANGVRLCSATGESMTIPPESIDTSTLNVANAGMMVIFTRKDNIEYMGATFPKVGVWVLKMDEENYFESIEIPQAMPLFERNVIKPMFMPNDKLIVIVYLDEDGNTTSNYSFYRILEAIGKGKSIILNYNGQVVTDYRYDETSIRFNWFNIEETYIHAYELEIHESGTIEYKIARS